MYYDGVYLPVIIFNLQFDCTFSSDIDHTSITLDHPVVGGFYVSYELTDVVGHANGVIIVLSN